jgi:hypothetical protein
LKREIEAVEERERILQERKEKLSKEKEAFQRTRQRKEDEEEIVDLCVGGALVTTTRSTLCSVPGILPVVSPENS